MKQNKVGKDKYENTEKGDRDYERKEHEQDTKKEAAPSVHVGTRGQTKQIHEGRLQVMDVVHIDMNQEV